MAVYRPGAVSVSWFKSDGTLLCSTEMLSASIRGGIPCVESQPDKYFFRVSGGLRPATPDLLTLSIDAPCESMSLYLDEEKQKTSLPLRASAFFGGLKPTQFRLEGLCDVSRISSLFYLAFKWSSGTTGFRLIPSSSLFWTELATDVFSVSVRTTGSAVQAKWLSSDDTVGLIGSDYEFQLQLYDAYFNPLTVTDSQLSLLASAHPSANVTVSDIGDGSCIVKFSPASASIYKVNVSLGHESILREFAAIAGGRVSVIPFTGCRGVTLRGVEWPLNAAQLAPGISSSVSNRAVQETIHVSIDAGDALLFIGRD
jgi:hypothetical protein